MKFSARYGLVSNSMPQVFASDHDSRVTKKFTKVLEQVKNDEGEIINIKETKIEIEIEKEEAPILYSVEYFEIV